MKTRLNWIISLFIVLSLVLSACAQAAAPTQVVEPQAPPTQAPVAEKPTAVPPTPTEAPTEEPAPDFAALAAELIASIPPDKGYGTVGAAKLNEEMADKAPFLLDVREAAEVEKDGFIDGAVNIPVRDVLKNLDKLPGLDDPIVIYCASGHRGGLVLTALKMLGYTNVRNLGGGTGAWKKANLPLVTGAKPAEAAAISKPIVADGALFTALDAFLSGLPEGFYTVKADKLGEAVAAGSAPFLLDVRSADEVGKDGYIEGSVNIPLPDFMNQLDKLPGADKPIVIYCASGHRGAIAMMALRLMGYTDVSNLGGGLGAWKAAKQPVVGWVDWSSVWGAYMTSLPKGFYSIKADALNTALAEATPPFLLDVREAAEIEKTGHIAGAIHIPVRDVLKNLDKLPGQTQPIVIYCASGHRGGMIMAALQMLGYTNVSNLAGGTGAWTKAEFPLVEGLPPAATAGKAPEVDATRLRDLDAFLSALPEGFFTVKPADLNAEIAGGTPPVMIDVRTPEEVANGMIEGAVHIEIKDLLADMTKLPADKAAAIVLICQSGHRGAFGMMALRMLGYTNVRNLGGGMNAWTAAELPVVK